MSKKNPSTPQSIFIVTPLLEGWPIKAKEAPSPYEVRLTRLDTNPIACLIGGTLDTSGVMHNSYFYFLSLDIL